MEIKVTKKEITVEGMMTFDKLGAGQRMLDFMCCEDVALEPFTGLCKVQAMRDGNVYITEKPKRVRNNSLLICKAKHGRLSGTRDHAWQLTLKVFASEGIDWQKAFVTEPVEVMTDLMGHERMREILKEMLNRLNAEYYGE
jgi:hypothetical protein